MAKANVALRKRKNNAWNSNIVSSSGDSWVYMSVSVFERIGIFCKWI